MTGNAATVVFTEAVNVDTTLLPFESVSRYRTVVVPEKPGAGVKITLSFSMLQMPCEVRSRRLHVPESIPDSAVFDGTKRAPFDGVEAHPGQNDTDVPGEVTAVRGDAFGAPDLVVGAGNGDAAGVTAGTGAVGDAELLLTGI